MANIEIYTKNYCPYCHRAKALLQSKGAAFTEYDVTDNPVLEEEMRRRSRRRTVPEIFIGGQLVGGCDDLMQLEETGKLNRLLGIPDTH